MHSNIKPFEINTFKKIEKLEFKALLDDGEESYLGVI